MFIYDAAFLPAALAALEIEHGTTSRAVGRTAELIVAAQDAQFLLAEHFGQCHTILRKALLVVW